MFKVYDKPCDQCLISSNAIVDNDRRTEIIQGCIRKQTHFICHKASIEGEDVCCKTFYDKLGQHSQMIRIAERLNMVEIIKQKDE